MVGKFDVVLTGTETSESKDGKNVYFYANLLQGSEVKRARIANAAEFGEVSKIPPLTKMNAELDIAEGFYAGTHYTRYSLVNYTLTEKR